MLHLIIVFFLIFLLTYIYSKIKFRNYVPKDDNLKYFCGEVPEDYTSLLQAKYDEMLKKYEEEVSITLSYFEIYESY